MKRALLPIVSIMALASTIALASDEAVKLARVFKSGQGWRYEGKTEMKVGGAEATQIATIWKEVKEVRPNGVVVCAVTFEGGHIKSPLGEQDLPGGIII